MTKLYILVLALTAAGVAPAQTAKAQASPAQTTPASTTKAATKQGTAKKTATKRDPSLPEGVPDNAKSYKPYYWRAVDKQGVAWIYHTTPFGIVHDQETAEDRAEMAAIKAKVVSARPDMVPGELTIVDKGDSLEFTRQMPFGPTRWTAKKTELNQEEATAWARAQAAAAAKR